MFDSGSGGLSVLVEIRKVLPKANIVYLGDIKNAPYGGKSREELETLTNGLIEKLLAEGADKIVSACNSVSAAVALGKLSILRAKHTQVVEMVGPTVAELRDEKRKILLIATPATINSGMYQSGFKTVEVEIEVVPLPDLAGAIEFGEDENDMSRMIEKAFARVPNFSVLLLGCTHYPLVKHLFEKVLQKMKMRVEIVDPAKAVAREVKKRLFEEGSGLTRFLITKESALFRKRVAELFVTEGVLVEVI